MKISRWAAVQENLRGGEPGGRPGVCEVMERLKPYAPMLAISAIILAILVIFGLRNTGRVDEDAGNSVAASTKPAVERRCASQRTYDRIKTELFRRAAQTRGSDQQAFDRLSSYSVVRMERPLLTNVDPDLGTVRCSGVLSVDLPPGVQVVGGRRTLSAEIDYVLQPAADGSGDVVILEGADPIVVPLATLANTGTSPATPMATTEPDIGSAPPTDVPSAAQPAAVQPVEPPTTRPAPPREAERSAAPTASGRPSFNCRYARTNGEIAVCRDGGLAALDRQMASQYYRAIAAGDARQRRLLTTTRDGFLRYRDGCRSDACIADAYRGRMREIRDIRRGVNDGVSE